MKLFGIEDDFLSVFKSDEEVSGYHFSELKGLSMENQDSKFEQHDHKELKFVDQKQNYCNLEEGLYTGQMSACNQRHGYGFWKSEENGNELFGNWFQGLLMDGTEISMKGHTKMCNHLIQSEHMEAKHTNKEMCAVNIALLKEIHKEADKKQQKLKDEVKLLKMRFNQNFLFYLFDHME